VATAADGSDSYNGNGGTDTYDLSGLLTGATINLGAGTATGGDTLTNIENVIGSQGIDTITGTGTANVLDGQGGADTINAGGGADTVIGGAGNDIMNGGADNDTFVFAAGFGADTINGFDANPTGGQDLLDISALGITAATFGSSVLIQDLGANTLVMIGVDAILLNGVNGTAPNVITQADFILAP